VEIVSKVILPHTNLSTTQRHLGMFADTETIRGIKVSHQIFNGYLLGCGPPVKYVQSRSMHFKG
jgi:hypothetical protein